MSHAPLSAECLNCRATLAGPYCAACGQKASAANPTFHDLMHEFLHETLHVDGRIWRSVWMLLARPGRITLEYCAGHKARYLAPLRLYLIFSVIAVATSTLPSAHSKHEESAVTQTIGRTATTPQTSSQPSNQQTDQRDVVQVKSLTFGKLTGKLTEQEVRNRLLHAWHDWLPRMNLVLLPVWAWLAMLVTRKARRTGTHNFPEYLYFALHANAAFQAAFALDNLIDLLPWTAADDIGDFISFAYIVGYSVIGLRLVFGGSWIRNLLRAAGVGVLYGIVYGVGFVAVMAAALLL